MDQAIVVTSKTSLSPSLQAEIKNALNYSDPAVPIHFTHDPQLLFGLKITGPGFVYDLTGKYRLDQLLDALSL